MNVRRTSRRGAAARLACLAATVVAGTVAGGGLAQIGATPAAARGGPGTPAALPAAWRAPVPVNPDPPTHVIAVAGSASVTVSWTAPGSFGTGTLVRYVATADPPTGTCSTAAGTTCTLTGLAPWTTYTVTVVTETTDGTSLPSAPSNKATPVPTPPGTSYPKSPQPDSSRVSADFSGDGRDDIAVLYDYGTGRVELWTMTALGDGGFSRLIPRWQEPNWGRGTAFVSSGDFDGDGDDDLAMLYDYGADRVALLTLTSAGDGTFGAPVPRWASHTWGTRTTHLSIGDLDGDGLDDVALFYDYGAGSVALFTLAATGSGVFDPPALRWTSPWWGGGTRFMGAGNFAGSLVRIAYPRDDLALCYDYGDGRIALFAMVPTGVGDALVPVLRWTTPWWGLGTHLMTIGEFTGDGRDDIALLYDYGGGSVGLFTFATAADGSLAAPVNRWFAGAWGPYTRFMTARNSTASAQDDILLFVDDSEGGVGAWRLTPSTAGGIGAVLLWRGEGWGEGTNGLL